MQSEFNEIILTNDVAPTNATAAEYTPVTATAEVAERADTATEAADSIAHTSGKISKIASKTIALAGVITVAATVAVAAADVLAPSAPAAVVSDITVTSFIDDSELALQFTFTDTGEIEEYTVWIEDGGGIISECGIENEDDIYTAYATLADGTDTENGLYLVIYADTNEGWSGEICRQQITLPAAPEVTIADLSVAYNADDGGLTIDFTFTNVSEIDDYFVYLEDGSGVTSTCSVEDDGEVKETNTAYATLTDGTDTDNLYLVVYATTNEGWSGEICRQQLTLPAAPVYEFLYADIDPTYSENDGVGDVELYFDYGTDYPDSLPQNVYAYEIYFADEGGQTYSCEITSSGSGVIWAAVTLPVDGTVAFDIYGRLTLVIRAYTDEGWEGTIYSDKFVVAADGYISLPEISSVEITSSLDGEIYYTYVTVQTYDPNIIWSDLYITVYDDNGQLITEQLVTTNESIVWEEVYYNDEICGYIFYISYQSATITLIDDYYLYAVITATWCEPLDDGTENIYESVVYDDYVYLS